MTIEIVDIATPKSAVFSREQILKSKKITHSPDILRVVLEPDRKYSLAEVDKLVKEFKSRKVV